MSRAGVIVSAAAGTLLLASALSAAAARNAGRRAPGSLVPAYLYPTRSCGSPSARTLPQLLVVNPASGPGAAPPTRTTGARSARRRRGGVARPRVRPDHLGRARPLAAVEADSRPLPRAGTASTAIFLDEAATDPRELPYYRTLSRDAARRGAGFVVLNPGVVPAARLLRRRGRRRDLRGPVRRLPQPASPTRVARARATAHLVYGGVARAGAARARGRAGRATPTSPRAALPHPWGTVPDYLAAELAALGGCAMNDNLWARRGRERHHELYDAEYAKQLERIARIRSEVSAALPRGGRRSRRRTGAPAAPPAGRRDVRLRTGRARRGAGDTAPADFAPPAAPRATDPWCRSRPGRTRDPSGACPPSSRSATPAAGHVPAARPRRRRSQPRAPGERGAG